MECRPGRTTRQGATKFEPASCHPCLTTRGSAGSHAAQPGTTSRRRSGRGAVVVQNTAQVVDSREVIAATGNKNGAEAAAVRTPDHVRICAPRLVVCFGPIVAKTEDSVLARCDHAAEVAEPGNSRERVPNPGVADRQD